MGFAPFKLAKPFEMTFDAKAYIKDLPQSPGIYQMLNSTNEISYIGKAKNLKNRVSSYFQKTDHEAKTKVMVSQIARVEVMITANENDALVLEQQLIKKQLLQTQINNMLRRKAVLKAGFLNQSIENISKDRAITGRSNLPPTARDTINKKLNQLNRIEEMPFEPKIKNATKIVKASDQSKKRGALLLERNRLQNLKDHTDYVLWLGSSYKLNIDMFRK